MPVKPRIDVERALASENPLMALRDAAAAELHHVPRDEVVAALEEAMLGLRAAGRDDEEDVVTNAIDFVVGWCSPHMRI